MSPCLRSTHVNGICDKCVVTRNTSKLPNWPVYSVARRDTMLFNNECKVEQDPAQPARLAMERVLKLA